MQPDPTNADTLIITARKVQCLCFLTMGFARVAVHFSRKARRRLKAGSQNDPEEGQC